MRRAFSPSFWTFRRGGPSSFRRRPSRNRSKIAAWCSEQEDFRYDVRSVSDSEDLLVLPFVMIQEATGLERMETRGQADSGDGHRRWSPFALPFPSSCSEMRRRTIRRPPTATSPISDDKAEEGWRGKRETRERKKVEDAECGGDRKPKSLRGSTFRLSRWKSLRSEKNPSTPAEAVLHISTILELGRRDDRDRRPVLRS